MDNEPSTHMYFRDQWNAKQKQPGAVKKRSGQAKNNQEFGVPLEMAGKIKGWYQFAAKCIGKTKDWYQVAAKCIGKNTDWYQVVANRIGKIIQGLIQEQIYMQIFLNCHLAAF